MFKVKHKNKYEEKIEKLSQDNVGVTIRKLCNNKKIYVLYISQITDRERVSSDIIKPILQYSCEENLTIDIISKSVIYMDDIDIDNDENKIEDYILKGKSIIIIDDEDEYIIANTYKVEKRGIEGPQIQNLLRGPRDAFTENFETNLSLIRYRIKDSSLRIDTYSIGERTKTSIAVVYLKDVTNPRYVNEIEKRLKKIKTDGIFESGYIEKFIFKDNYGIFPRAGMVERSDAACANLLKGKICIIIEGSNFGLVVPQNFGEFLDAGDNHYENTYVSVISKVLRIIALGMSLVLSSLYVALVSFNPDVLPGTYIVVLASSRVTVPVNALLEVTLMEVVTDILKESSIRLPKPIGPAISIVGTIVIGQAAVSAGVVSSLTVIIISLSTMTSFAAPDYTITSPISLLKYVLIFITGVFGLFGFVIGFTFIVINVTSIESLEVPYTAPIAPLNLKDLKNCILSDITKEKERPSFFKTKDKKKQ
ncbi:spore germination protein [Haloimpatiens sp. FM7330]|uniref:spore germination protein n=1 Tax=Haloimpatiens sp. FM7330 TaxID=3298610 RepID=UPI00363488B2